MTNIISHLKLEKGSIIVLQGDDYNRETIEAFRTAVKALDLGFKVPIIGLDSDCQITVSERDQVVKQLDRLVHVTDVKNN